MATGTVKWFNNAKGYGFILPEGGGEDLFAHYSSIVMDGYKTLKSGQKVNYELIQGPKGLHAANICPTDQLSPNSSSVNHQADQGNEQNSASDQTTLGVT